MFRDKNWLDQDAGRESCGAPYGKISPTVIGFIDQSLDRRANYENRCHDMVGGIGIARAFLQFSFFQ